ncbi:MAG: CPBP family intramembrane metalloprotease [Clostridium sartagoforme]|nr:CPBP family intramembrane metalloprotease [Clostridium sartagoforme]
MKEKVKVFFASIGYLLLAAAIQLVVTIVAGIGLGFYYVIKQAVEINNGSNGFNYDVDSFIGFNLSLTNIFILISSILTILALILIYKIRKKNYKEELQIKKTTNFNIVYAIILGISCWLFNAGVLSLISEVGLFTDEFLNMEQILAPLSSGSVIMSIITIGIIAPFAEEFLFRGVIYNTLSKKISIKWTIIIQAILFGIYHGNIIQGSYATLLGLVFGYVTYKTRSLWPAVIIHMVNNLIATTFMYVPSSMFSGILVYVVFVIVGVIGLTVCLLLVKNKNQNNEEIYDFNNLNNLS